MLTKLMNRRALMALLAVVMASPAAAKPATLQPLEIVTDRGRHAFQVEFVDTDATRAKGLMYRKSLAPNRGMLFDFKTERPVGFWMKNTFIPLDMIFIRADGRILSIARNTTPHSEANVPSGGAVRYVLEIPGGRAAQLGVLPGDRVLHRAIPRG